MKLEDIQKEAVVFGGLFLLSLILFKIAFSSENLLVIVRFVLTLFWVFIVPGYFLTLLWKKELGLAERLSVGTLLSAAFIGIASYYFGLIGFPIWYHWIVIPVLLSAAGYGTATLKND